MGILLSNVAGTKKAHRQTKLEHTQGMHAATTGTRAQQPKQEGDFNHKPQLSPEFELQNINEIEITLTFLIHHEMKHRPSSFLVSITVSFKSFINSNECCGYRRTL